MMVTPGQLHAILCSNPFPASLKLVPEYVPIQTECFSPRSFIWPAALQPLWTFAEPLLGNGPSAASTQILQKATITIAIRIAGRRPTQPLLWGIIYPSFGVARM